MITPWSLVAAADARAVLAAWALLAGFLMGAACVACFVGWLRLRTPTALREENRLLRVQRNDLAERLAWVLADCDDQGAQIRHLYAQLDRMAALVGERAGQRPTVRPR